MQQPLPRAQEDFYLLDVIGGASITALHPTRPIIAYSSGCMIIVYDVLTDQKINLVHHQSEVTALAFSPPGAASQTSTVGSGGEFLISVDMNTNDLSDMGTHSLSTMCFWHWQRGELLQEIPIPRSQNNVGFLLQPNQGGASPRSFQIAFEKVGGTFMVLDTSSSDMNGGGYRATIWVINRQQRIDMLGQLELELTATCLGLQIVPFQKTVSSSLNPSLTTVGTQYLQTRLRFLTLERNCVKIWEYQAGHAELLKKIQIK